MLLRLDGDEERMLGFLRAAAKSFSESLIAFKISLAVVGQVKRGEFCDGRARVGFAAVSSKCSSTTSQAGRPIYSHRQDEADNCQI